MGYSLDQRNSGRGRGRFYREQGSKSQHYSKTNRNTLADNLFNIGTVKSSSEYTSIKDYIINYVRNTYDCGDNIATALERLEEYNFENDKPLRIQPAEGETFTTKEEEDNN